MASSLPPLAQACAGAFGSATANAVSYPLDLVATKLQISQARRTRGLNGAVRLLRYILRKEGLAGLYDGLGADTASTIVSNFLYYYFYSLLHALATRRRSSISASLLQTVKHAITSPTRPVLLDVPTELALGFVAGIASRAISTPLNVITVRLQTATEEEKEEGSEDIEQSGHEKSTPNPDHDAPPPGFSEVVRRMYREDGFLGFWAGFRPTLPLCLTPALTLLFFQLLNRLPIPWKVQGSRQSPLGAFLSGASANALAVTILYPLLLAKVRVQAAEAQKSKFGVPRAATSVTGVWADAVKRDGWAGLYQALEVQILKGFVSQGVTMLVKQRVERVIVLLYNRN